MDVMISCMLGKPNLLCPSGKPLVRTYGYKSKKDLPKVVEAGLRQFQQEAAAEGYDIVSHDTTIIP